MSFAAPLYLVAAALAAVGVVVLHYIVMRQPPHDIFPTARFLPVRAAVMRTWARRPEQIVLLVLRTSAVIAVGAAFARPIWHPARAPLVRIIVADRSRDVAIAREVVDSVRRLISGPHDVVVAFDSSPSVITAHVADSLAALSRRQSPGNISAALVSALRSVPTVQAFGDSIEVALVSPAARDELDAATDSIRALWPGVIRLVRVGAHQDILNAAHVVVRWPDSTRARHTIDTTTAAVSSSATIIAQLERRWSADTAGGVIVARWIDGEPAAVERATPDGCVRSVVVPIPTDGDLTLRPEFARFARTMHAPCGSITWGGGGEWTPDAGRPVRVATRAMPTASTRHMAWLLAVAIALLLAELWVRR